MLSKTYPLQFRESYYTGFTIPSQFAEMLAYYKRVNWSAAYFLNQWESNIGTYAAGTIRRYNQINHVQFCAGCSIGQIKFLLETYPELNLQLDLSFRKANGMPAFVLVDFKQADKKFILESLNQNKPKVLRSNMDEWDS